MTRVAAIQMNSGADLQANLQQAAGLIREAANGGAEFALLPEFFPLLSDDDKAKVKVMEKPGGGPLQDFLAQQAGEHGIWLMGGTVPIDCGDSERIYNSCLLYTPEGKLSHSYDKIHLFDVAVDADESYNESNSIAPGKDLVVADTPLGQFGMTVCYDLRFPELYRKLVDQGAEIFTVPSAFTYATGKRHWQMLLQARAVENLCFVIAANQTGNNTETRRTWGHSMIVHPWGDVLACVEDEPGVAIADIDLKQVAELRQSFPTLNHRTIGVN
ncbi:MAG: carbon-nitrogen hydrolase family protein [Gammaproteobacteria bacterium]